MKQKLMTLLLFLATFSALAQSLPRMKDNYVTDAADILSKSELKQLRTDVRSMCDYYSTRIVVGIVSTFGEYDIDEYAGELAEKWDLSDENTMLILVKPKSDEERGEALLLASSDLKDVFTNDVCDEIVREQMIPHFKNDDYFGGIEAALEYMNNMSSEEEESEEVAVAAPPAKTEKSSSKFMEFLSDVGVGAVTIVKWGLILLAIAAVIGLIAWLIIRKKEEKEDREEAQAHRSSNLSSRNDSEEISTAIADKRQEIERRKRDIEELDRLEQESRDLDNKYDNMRERSERNERARRRDYDDYDDRDDYDDYDDRDDDDRDSRIEDILEKMSRSQESSGKGRSILGTAAKVAAGVAGAAVVGKIVKKRRENDKDDDEGGLLSDIGGVFKKKDKSSSSSSSKPKLGGSGKSNASGSKPKLGGGGNKPSKGNKPKLGGNSSSGGW